MTHSRESIWQCKLTSLENASNSVHWLDAQLIELCGQIFIDSSEFWIRPQVFSSYPLGFNWVTGETSDPRSQGMRPQGNAPSSAISSVCSLRPGEKNGCLIRCTIWKCHIIIYEVLNNHTTITECTGVESEKYIFKKTGYLNLATQWKKIK